MITESINCSQEILNCISRYRETLAENKKAIERIYNHPNDLINVNDYLYKGDKTCTEERFQQGQDCYGTVQANKGYDEWKQKIEATHAKDLVGTLKEGIKDPTVQDNIKGKISSIFEHNKQLVQDVRTELMGNVIEQNLDRSRANSKIEEMTREKLNQAETDEQVIFWDIIRSLYQEKDPAPNRGHFEELRLECHERECFDTIVGKKLEGLESEKKHFLGNIEKILQYTRSDSVDDEAPHGSYDFI